MCKRTPQVQKAIIDKLSKQLSISQKALKAEDCYLANELLNNIQELNLKDQNITSLKSGDFSGMTHLKDLNLNNNKLTTLPWGVFLHSPLNFIRLKANQIRSLPENLFTETVIFINLSNNNLTTLPRGIFDHVGQVHIDLSYNKITHLPPNIFSTVRPLSIKAAVPVTVTKTNPTKTKIQSLKTI